MRQKSGQSFFLSNNEEIYSKAAERRPEHSVYVSKQKLMFYAFQLLALDEREFSHIIYWKFKREETVLL